MSKCNFICQAWVASNSYESKMKKNIQSQSLTPDGPGIFVSTSDDVETMYTTSIKGYATTELKYTAKCLFILNKVRKQA